MFKKIFFILIVVIILAGGAAYFWWENGLSPVNPGDTTKKTFVVMNGEGTRRIADDLRKSGFIKDPLVFSLLIKKSGLEGKIQAGEFKLSPAMTAEEVLENLQVGTFDVVVTIPEGKRADEVADILKYNFSNYEESWRGRLEAEEGYLFPDTYYFAKDSDIDMIISKMKENFDKKFAAVPDGKKDALSTREIVIIASLVEREAGFDEDRPLVASVILNRYRIGMKLDLDSTIQYALGYQRTENSWWKKNLTYDDLEIDSSYNTYRNAGLPPGPIANPGLRSIEAVVDAPSTNYLYYVADKDGHTHYASTLEGHNENVRKYRD